MTDTSPKLLIGFKAIGNFLGIAPWQARWLAENNGLPIFRIENSRSIFARPESLRQWLHEEEERGQRERQRSEPVR